MAQPRRGSNAESKWTAAEPSVFGRHWEENSSPVTRLRLGRAAARPGLGLDARCGKRARKAPPTAGRLVVNRSLTAPVARCRSIAEIRFAGRGRSPPRSGRGRCATPAARGTFLLPARRDAGSMRAP